MRKEKGERVKNGGAGRGSEWMAKGGVRGWDKNRHLGIIKLNCGAKKYFASIKKVCTFAPAFKAKKVVWPRG